MGNGEWGDEGAGEAGEAGEEELLITNAQCSMTNTSTYLGLLRLRPTLREATPSTTLADKLSTSRSAQVAVRLRSP